MLIHVIVMLITVWKLKPKPQSSLHLSKAAQKYHGFKKVLNECGIWDL
jgi:hypothetical protein